MNSAINNQIIPFPVPNEDYLDSVNFEIDVLPNINDGMKLMLKKWVADFNLGHDPRFLHPNASEVNLLLKRAYQDLMSLNNRTAWFSPVNHNMSGSQLARKLDRDYLSIGRNRMYADMQSMRILNYNNMPADEYLYRGFITYRQSARARRTTGNFTPVFTPAGVAYLLPLIVNHYYFGRN